MNDRILSLDDVIVFDGASPDLVEGFVVIEDGLIREVGTGRAPRGGDHVSGRGATLMPGLIDAHVHVYAPEVDVQAGDRLPLTAVAHHAARMLEGCLRRGFTTVRDCGGADAGLRLALAKGWMAGPRVIACGKALSQTGGHGDLRNPHHNSLCSCGSGYAGHVTAVVDGADALRQRVREQMHAGAAFVKIMGSGGVSSVGDALESSQYADDEIVAVVDEARRHGTYVTAHCHPDAAIRRCIQLGVAGIEHAILISEATAALAAECNVALTPTLAVAFALSAQGGALGYPPEALAKLAEIQPVMLSSLEIVARSGARMGFGTDLIGPLHTEQHREFALRREVLSPFEILRSATSVNADIIGQGDRLGRVAPGYVADLILVEGNPLEDIGVFDAQGSNVVAVLQAGRQTRPLVV